MEQATSGRSRFANGNSVLIIDDSTDAHLMLGERLEREGYSPIVVRSGEEAFGVIRQRGLPDMVLLDLMIPGMDAFRVAETIQQMGSVPIICVSALADVDSKVDAISRFADDYVTKPFAFSELLARMQRILRRVSPVSSVDSEVQVDENLRVNFSQQYAVVANRRVNLTPIESRIMQLLYRHRGRVLSPKFLIHSVWGETSRGKLKSLWVHVRRLRKKIEPEPDQPRYIVTIRGQGYCMQI